MSALLWIRSVFRTLFAKDALEADLDAELSSYIEMVAEEKVRQGLGPAEARRQALIELGGAEQVKVRVREGRHGAGLDTLRRDVRYGLRVLRRSPGFTLVAVATLSIGIAATTALFSTIEAVLLRDLTFPEPERLVAGVKTLDGRPAGPVSRVDYYDYRELCGSFADLALVTSGAGRFAITGEGPPELVVGAGATWNLFQMLGETPVAGRSFLADEETRGDAVAVISYGLWQRRFGGAPDAVGSVIHLDSVPVTVIGVLPRGFQFLFDVDVWALIGRQGPFAFDATRDSHSHYLVGRLKPKVSLEEARGEIDAVASHLAQQFPDTNQGKGVRLSDLHRFMVWQARPSLLLLMATAGLVLLIACGNVAGLQLARGQRRMSEMAMRSALGASRRRLVHLLLTESVLLTMLAGLVGVGLSYLVLAILVRVLPLGSPGVALPAIDGGALLFCLGVSLTTGLLVGIIPALRGASITPGKALGSGARATEGVRGAHIRSALVVAQVALSIVLLIGCGLLTRSLGKLVGVDLGFEPTNVLTAVIRIQPADHPTPAQRRLFFSSMLEEIRARPDVVSVSCVSKVPIASTATDWPIWPADQPRPANNDSYMALARWVAPGYFRTLGMPLLRGRDISERDLPGMPPVVVVTEEVARSLFPGRDPIGQRVGLGWADETFEVIGVVGGARINGLREAYGSAMYLSAAQTDASGLGMGITVNNLGLVVRTSRDPGLLVEPIRALLQDKDENALLGEPMPMTVIVDRELTGFRVVILSLGLFSGIAMLLCAIGLYGVLAYHVGQCGREIGVRMAFGAPPSTLAARFAARGLALVAAGMALGALAAVPCGSLIRGFLFNVGPWDPLSFASAFALLASIGVLACLLPALRATRVDPASMLRAE
jgi:putative ABC transport system permease protein